MYIKIILNALTLFHLMNMYTKKLNIADRIQKALTQFI